MLLQSGKSVPVKLWGHEMLFLFGRSCPCCEMGAQVARSDR